MLRRAGRALLISGALAATVLTTAPAAGAASMVEARSTVAATTCGGTLVFSKNLNYNGTKIGELDIYYNSANGNNCALMLHGGPSWGQSRDTWVYIGRCQATNPTGTCVLDTGSSHAADASQRGDFRYQAGPVSIWAGAHCITANGYIYWQGARRHVYTPDTALC